MQYHSIPEHSSGTHPPNIHSQLSTSPTLSQSSLYTAYYTPHRSTHSRPNHTHHSPVYPVVSLGLSGPPSWNHIHRHDSIPIESLLSNTDCIYPTISIPIPPSVKTTLVGPAPIETVSLSTIATRTLSIVTIASRPTHREPIAIEPISSSHSLHSEPSPIHRLTLVSSTYTSPLSIPTPLSRIHLSHKAVVNYHRYQYLHAYPTRSVTLYNSPIRTNTIYYLSSPVAHSHQYPVGKPLISIDHCPNDPPLSINVCIHIPIASTIQPLSPLANTLTSRHYTPSPVHITLASHHYPSTHITRSIPHTPYPYTSSLANPHSPTRSLPFTIHSLSTSTQSLAHTPFSHSIHNTHVSPILRIHAHLSALHTHQYSTFRSIPHQYNSPLYTRTK